MKYILAFLFLLFSSNHTLVFAQWDMPKKPGLKEVFQNPPETSKPWVFWYWMRAAVTKDGIKADLEAMKEIGIAGAYLVPIQEEANPPFIEPPVNTFTPQWWEMIKFAFEEAKRLGLKITMHCGDGYATAGGTWITPELSMQRVVWSEVLVDGGKIFYDSLPSPLSKHNYYQDIAILAFPSPEGSGINTRTVIPRITTDVVGASANFLVKEGNREVFRSDNPCWFQYEFTNPFTCRSIKTIGGGTNLQAHRLWVLVSNNGSDFDTVCRLQPPRHGWQDSDADYTHSIPTVTGRYFRFVFNNEGTEPGAEDYDNAKWKPNLKLRGLELSSAPAINHFEGKNGSVWRIGERVNDSIIPGSLCVPKEKIVDLTENYQSGMLRWNAPPGKWTILRMGHTTTGHQNATAGKGKGLECDKLNPEVAYLQFKNWYGTIEDKLGQDLTKAVLANIHVDSWECASQNWSPVFKDEFYKRRGYDLTPYLPLFAGIPIQSADISERFLYDVRKTIAELVADNFFGTLAKLAKEKGYGFSAESVAPVMTSDNLLHFKYTDYPMGEFWVNSPSHDKPTDMIDAVSAGHIYGKNIIQAEAFTTLRMDWNENPSNLKVIGDRNFALGVNRFVYHVFCQNPWPNRKPGMTLGPIGLFFQPAQTWWKPGKAWVEYKQRCQALLQEGYQEVDIAVFTGEELPSRAILPERLIKSLPGLFPETIVSKEAQRMKNTGAPQIEKPHGVNVSVNTSNPADWVNPMPGYKFDSFNSDALLNLAKVVDGKVIFSSGTRYSFLVFPLEWFETTNKNWMSPKILSKISSLINDGAQVLLCKFPEQAAGLGEYPLNDRIVEQLVEELKTNLPQIPKKKYTYSIKQMGQGILIHGIYNEKALFEPDFIVTDSLNRPCTDIAWSHRKDIGFDIYFVSNQTDKKRYIDISMRASGRKPEIWDPVTGEMNDAAKWRVSKGRTTLPLMMHANQSLFIIMRETSTSNSSNKGMNWIEPEFALSLDSSWQVQFDIASGGPVNAIEMKRLSSWHLSPDSAIRFYSGTAIYKKTFNWEQKSKKSSRKWLDLGNVGCIASITVNGHYIGVAWTHPFRVEITNSLKPGVNSIEIKVTNTWINRLIGDYALPENKKVAQNAFPFHKIENKKLVNSGLIGPVAILEE